MKNLSMLLLPILIFQSVCHSATFCVTTSAELQTAFDDANGNNQHNSIRIAEGDYLTPGSGFSYNPLNTNTGWDLEISGGWSLFFNNPCGQQLSGNPFLTVLDANGNNRVMQIIAFGNADITISNLFFINGLIGEAFHGGGLEVRSFLNDHTGNLRLQQNAFINNEAGSGSAMSLSGFTKMVIKNNLFISNNAIFSSAVSLVQNDAYGIYFTNNTVYNNKKNNYNGSSAGLYLAVSGSSNSAIYNNLLWKNDHNFGSENIDLQLVATGKHYLSHNDIGVRIGSEPVLDAGNISVAPRFASGFLNFTQLPSSMLINAGLNPQNVAPIPTPFEQAWDLGVFDLLGNIRKQMGQVDIGSHESPYSAPIVDLIYENSFE